jgi:hypothetical protein
VKWVYKLQRKVGRDFGIPNLMIVIVIAKLAVFLFSSLVQINAASFLLFSREAVLRGEIWRALTFVFIPDDSNLLWLAFSLYFYWWIGSSLEHEWGTLGFNVFYFMGMVLAIIGGFITGFATDLYLNITLFLAFATLFPNVEIRLFFFIPIRVKWLGWFNAAVYLFLIIVNSWPGRLEALLSLLNLLLFFGRDYYESVKGWIHHIKNRKNRYK